MEFPVFGVQLYVRIYSWLVVQYELDQNTLLANTAHDSAYRPLLKRNIHKTSGQKINGRFIQSAPEVAPAHWLPQRNLAIMRSSVYELESRRAISIEDTHSNTLNLR